MNIQPTLITPCCERWLFHQIIIPVCNDNCHITLLLVLTQHLACSRCSRNMLQERMGLLHRNKSKGLLGLVPLMAKHFDFVYPRILSWAVRPVVSGQVNLVLFSISKSAALVCSYILEMQWPQKMTFGALFQTNETKLSSRSSAADSFFGGKISIVMALLMSCLATCHSAAMDEKIINQFTLSSVNCIWIQCLVCF